MTAPSALERGREAFARSAWAEARSLLSEAETQSPLAVDDLERLALASHLSGRDDLAHEVLTRAHNECLKTGDVPRAVRFAFWLAFSLVDHGEFAQVNGWLNRGSRLLDEHGLDCVERGYLLAMNALMLVAGGDPEASYRTFTEAAEFGKRFAEPDLIALTSLGRGRALINLGRVDEGVPLLDEAMVSVTSSELSPLIVGVIYCATVEACQEIFDLRRAREWTAALSHWCQSQPELVPYGGQCLVYRSEIMQLHGAWPDAADEAQRACERLSGQPGVGSAFYQQAEIHRLRGEFAKAEATYRQANQWGHNPQPGLARLRLAQGQVQAAVAAIRRSVDEAHDRMARSRLLAAQVEVLLAAGDVTGARTAADELLAIAAGFDAPLLQAMAAHAHGAVLLGEGDPRAAGETLRRAWTGWRTLEAPYEAARARVLLGHACRQVGDDDSAQMEFDAARWVFQQLGAAPDLARVEALTRTPEATAPGGLTARELEVIALLAQGMTNRAIADQLVISEKTVARHVSNIFDKLEVSSRSAATAYAYEHGLAT